MESKVYTRLPSEESEDRIDFARHDRRRDIPFSQRALFHYIIYILLITSNLGTLGLWYRTAPPKQDAECVRPYLTYSPAKAAGAIRYEKKRLTADIDSNIYTGPPRATHDEAWARLLEPIAIKVSKEELDQLGEPSIPLLDGSGFIAEPSVYHELHCNKRIRRHRYLDYYYPNMTDLQRYRENLHFDHCLEYWRESAMCRGDMSLATFWWRGDEPVSRVYSDRECVNWDTLDKFARSVMVNMTDLGILDHGADVPFHNMPISEGFGDPVFGEGRGAEGPPPTGKAEDRGS